MTLEKRQNIYIYKKKKGKKEWYHLKKYWMVVREGDVSKIILEKFWRVNGMSRGNEKCASQPAVHVPHSYFLPFLFLISSSSSS